MKSLFKLFGIVILVVLIGFSITACSRTARGGAREGNVGTDGGGSKNQTESNSPKGENGSSSSYSRIEAGSSNDRIDSNSSKKQETPSTPRPGIEIEWIPVEKGAFDVNHVYGVAYGNGKYVAVGKFGKMAYSSDGITWTKVADNSNFNIGAFGRARCIAFGNGMFVAAGEYQRVAYSRDGINWTAAQIPRLDSSYSTSNTIVLSIAFGNGKLVAVGYHGMVAVSENGSDWNVMKPEAFGGQHINSIAFGNNTFVAVGNSTKIAHSSDGANWIAAGNKPTTAFNTIYSVAFGDDTFIASGNGRVSRSLDNGKNWDALTVTDNNYDIVYSLCYGNGMFIAGNSLGMIWTSADKGKTWTKLADRPLDKAIIYNITWNGSRFVMVGENGMMAYSDNGKDWNPIKNGPVNNSNFKQIIFDGKRFIAGATINRLVYSSDGAEWTSVDLEGSRTKDKLSGSVNGIAHDSKGTYVAVGNDGTIWTGSDVAAWQEIRPKNPNMKNETDLFPAYSFHNVVYGNDMFVIAGSEIAVSPDGKSWNRMNDIMGAREALKLNPIRGMIFFNEKFLASGDVFKADGSLSYAQNGLEWTYHGVIDAFKEGCFSINTIAAGNNMLIATMHDYISRHLVQSSDGLTWTDLPYTVTGPQYARTEFSGDEFTYEGYTDFEFRALAFGDGIWIGGGDNRNDILFSVDNGANWFLTKNNPFFQEVTNDSGNTTEEYYDQIISIAYGNGRFVAVGDNGRIMYSKITRR